MVCLGRTISLQNLKGCLPQIFLVPFLNISLIYSTNSTANNIIDINYHVCSGSRYYRKCSITWALKTTVDSLDWGTICIYTCKENCNPGKYVEEFGWKQDFSDNSIIG